MHKNCAYLNAYMWENRNPQKLHIAAAFITPKLLLQPHQESQQKEEG